MNTTTQKTRETREERAARKFHSLRFNAGNLTIRPADAPEKLVGVVFVQSGENLYTVNLCSDESGDLHPCGCNCKDAQRRKGYEHFPAPCYHQIAASLWLTGAVPPLPGFDIDAEGELLAKLEQSERIERARREAVTLWPE